MSKESGKTVDSLTQSREKVIVRTSIIGILTNVLLSAAKAVIGLLANSIAVVLDAVNNLSDALSSVITIIGTKLAGRKPDKKHPLGHGRIEYVTAAIVSAIVLYAGITSLVESVKKIISPEEPDYSVVSLVIISLAIIVKLVLGLYVRKTGKKVKSGTLEASGTDALFDAILSTSVFLSAVVYLVFHVSLEAYVGVLISGFIIKAGIEMLLDTVNELLGKRADRETVEAIRKTIAEDPEISGVYDMILHDYGPEKTFGSVHVEVPDTMTADEIDLMERRITERVFLEHGVIMAGISIYSRNTKNAPAKTVREEVSKIVMSHEGVLEMHGFFADPEKKVIRLDIIIDFDVKDRESLFRHIKEDIQKEYPEYTVYMTLDLDV